MATPTTAEIIPLLPSTPVLLTDATKAPTQAQRIAGKRAADAANGLARILDAPMLTPYAAEQARALRITLERVCSELRRCGI